MPRVIHFELAEEDPEGAAAFYREVFGWEIVNFGGPVDYWLATTGPDAERGINGAIKQREPGGPATIVTIEVPSVDVAVGKVTKAGGKVVMGKTPIPGVGYLSYCEDPGGTLMGILEADEKAR